MKKVTDTYCCLNGKKLYISDLTRIKNDNSVIIDIINDIPKTDVSDNVITEITFGKINDDISVKVKEQFADADLTNNDAYIVNVGNGRICVYANTENAFLYAACAIHSHYDNGICEGIICNIPACEQRGVKVYVPAKENIEYFKEFVDMCMYYGYNTLYMEVGGAMEYKKHPEINEGWVEYAEFCGEYSGKAHKIQCSMPWEKNSIHWENGGKSYLSQEQIKDLVQYCNKRGITVIPEVPSLSHCDYLLTRHPELAENKDDPLPDTYCPSNPASYELLFDVLDEILEVFNPPIVHIAHDEWYQIGVCDKCKGKDPAHIFADDVWKIYEFLKERNVETMVWNDKLVSTKYEDGSIHHGGGCISYHKPTDEKIVIKGKEYYVHDEDYSINAINGTGGTLIKSPATYHAIDLVPKDLKTMNWLHSMLCTTSEYTDDEFNKRDMWSVFGNFDFGSMKNSKNWLKRWEKGVKGFCISNWSMLEQKHMQRNSIHISIAYGALMTWNRDFDETSVMDNLIKSAHDLYLYGNRHTLRNSHIEIIHGTSVIKPHPPFVDGNCINEESDRLGYYNVYYEDGTFEKVSVLWGINIGYNGDMDSSPESIDGTNPGVKYMVEPTYTCDFVLDSDNMYYKFVIPTKKPVKEVVPEIFDEYANDVIIKDITINN